MPCGNACLTCAQSISLFLQFYVSRCIAEVNDMNPETTRNAAFKQLVFTLFGHVKQTQNIMLKVRLINKHIMVSIGHDCVKNMMCAGNINVPKQSKHGYGKSRAGHFWDTQGSPSTSLSSQGLDAEQFDRAAKSPPCINYGCKNANIQVFSLCKPSPPPPHTHTDRVIHSGDTFKCQKEYRAGFKEHDNRSTCQWHLLVSW